MTNTNPLVKQWPIGAAVAAPVEGSETEHVDGWVIGHTLTDIVVEPDDPQIHQGAPTAILVEPGKLYLAEATVQVRWQAAWRWPTDFRPISDAPVMSQIGWLLQAVTQEYHDPSQRSDDLRTLAELITQNPGELQKAFGTQSAAPLRQGERP